MRRTETGVGPFAAIKATFDFNIKEVIESGDIAIMHTEWNVSSPHTMSVYAIEVAHRQADGTWRWLIGDPFTVGRTDWRLKLLPDCSSTGAREASFSL